MVPLQLTRQAKPAGQSKVLFAQLLPQSITQTPALQLLQTAGQVPPGGATPVLQLSIPAEPPDPLLPPLPAEPPWPPPLTPPSPALAPTPAVFPAPDELPLPPSPAVLPAPPARLPPVLALPPSPPAPTWASGGVSGNKVQPSAMPPATIQPALEPRNAV